jgi:hypothetical protein
MGSGGPRTGAGRPAHRAKAEQLCRISVNGLRRTGRLQIDGEFPWSWRAGNQPAGSMTICVTAGERLAFKYRMTSDGQSRDYSIPVKLLTSACNYGGSRYWFGCPICAKRVGVLYLRFKRFACRHCQQVAHSSQSEDAHGRTWRETWRLEARLGPNGKRPKGMRHATYYRLRERLIDCEIRREELFVVMAAPYLGRLRELES